MKLSLRVPYDKQLCPLVIPIEIYLQQGQHLDLGPWTLPAAQLYVVRVLDPDGRPIEGLPLRQQREAEHWGVAHNTDEFGDVYFYARPKSKVAIRVSANDLGVPVLAEGQRFCIWTFDLAEAEGEPPVFELPVSAELIRIFNEDGGREN